MNQAGATRIGRYEILTLLGEGGMARVYLACSRGPVGFDKLVVVKQVRPELAWDHDFITMFFDEARIAARLHHPNVVSTYEVVEEGGQYLLAMEYLEGHTLGEILNRLGRAQMPLDQHLWILTQVLAGLAYGHELRDYDGSPLGIVHRDVSPSNVFVTYNGEVKLLDFGIAKSAGAASSTQKGTVKGKIGYGAPEQFLARPVDGRADLYAVGVMLWEALAGKRRKQGDTPATAYEARVAGLEPRIREVKPDVPIRLADICDRATAVEPGGRFATAQQFQEALERYLEKRPRQVGQRDVATLINYHFKEERLARRREIEARLGAGPPPPSRELSAPSLTPVTLTETPPHAPPSRPAMTPPIDEVAHPPGVSGVRAARAPLRVGPKSLIAAGVVLVAGGVVTAALLRNHAAPPRAPVAALPVPAPPPAAPAAATPAPPPARTIQLTIDVEPRHAIVTLDGRALDDNPFHAEVARESRPHLLQASAPGYAAAARTVTFDDNIRVAIALAPAPAPGRRPHRSHRDERPTAQATPPPRLEPGMDLSRPPAAGPRRQIDEKDPYAP